ncbi:MAG TPA: Daple, partial [Micromonosporaceae bacterium]
GIDEVPYLPSGDVDGPELSRIASGLRDDVQSVPELPEELDVAAVLAAVRQVPGVRNAGLRPNPGGVHILRLDLADDADAGRVSRQVARLLKERMGLAAEPRRSRPATSAEPPASTGRRQSAGGTAGTRASGPNAPASAPPATPSTPTAPAAPTRPPPPAAADPGPRAYGNPAGTTVPGVAPSTAGPSAAYLAGMSSVGEPSSVDPQPGLTPRIVIDQVHVSTLGTEATVEVRLHFGDRSTVGRATGPAVDAYLLRLAAQAAAGAIDSLITAARGDDPSVAPHGAPVRCFIEHAGVVPFGTCVVAVVVVLVSGDGHIEQLVGSALVSGDPRQAIVRATLAAVNRRLEGLLA